MNTTETAVSRGYLSRITRHSWVLGFVLLCGLAGYYATGNASAERRGNPGPVSADTYFRTGNLNAAAVTRATGFTEFPLVWLGEQFKEYPLTDV